MSTGTDLLSSDAWRHDATALGRVARKLWLAAVAVLLAFAVALASFGLPSIGSEPADAAPVHTYCMVVGYRTVQGNFSWNKHETWQEPIHKCTYIEHNHSPFPDWLYTLLRGASDVAGTVAGGAPAPKGAPQLPSAG